jgi:hypothetical protein
MSWLTTWPTRVTICTRPPQLNTVPYHIERQATTLPCAAGWPTCFATCSAQPWQQLLNPIEEGLNGSKMSDSSCGKFHPAYSNP